MRMTAKAFSFIQQEHPDKMSRLEIEVSDFIKFRGHRRKKAKLKKDKTDTQRYGEQVGSILEWLDENTTEPYFPRVVPNQRLKWDTAIEFYFVEETDAMAFKLMFS